MFDVTQRTRHLVDEFLRLPPEERQEFVDEIRDKVDAVPDAEELAVLLRRADDVRRGVNIGRDLGEVLDDLERWTLRGA